MPGVPAGNYYQQGQGPSCWDRIKLGFMMGFSVGMATGALLGGFTALSWLSKAPEFEKVDIAIMGSTDRHQGNPCGHAQYGLRGRELMNNVGKVMLQSGGTFGTFLSIGAGIRC